MQEGSAVCHVETYRQLYEKNPPLDVKPIAQDAANLILRREQYERLQWRDDGTVQVRMGELIPGDGIPKQTLQGRRKRFRSALEKLLGEKGWTKVGANVYQPPDELGG